MNKFVRILEPVQTAMKRGVLERFEDAVRATKMKNVPAAPFGDTEDLDRLTRLIALANSQDAHVVGITGYEAGVGVSWTSRQLAAAYARFGRRALLVDASGAVDAPVARNGFEGEAPNLLDHATSIGPNVEYVDLANCQPLLDCANGVRDGLQAAAGKGYAVLVDLPAVSGSGQGMLATFSERAGACDLVFLVCVSGEMTQKELTRCVETCEVAGVKLGGLILNDWKLMGASLLAT